MLVLQADPQKVDRGREMEREREGKRARAAVS